MREAMKDDKYMIVRSSMFNDLQNLIQHTMLDLTKWVQEAKIDDTWILNEADNYANNFDIQFYLHRELRHAFKYVLWTYNSGGKFVIKKVTHSEWERLEKESDLNEYIISNLLGFTKVFRILTSLQKPIVGHNLLMDLMLLVEKFETPLPKSYTAFKKLVGTLFPNVYDTKCLSFDFKNAITDAPLWRQNYLQSLYDYFKDGPGRHLVANSPLIETSEKLQQMNFHDAGWDSYCTGYIFIRMSHVWATKKCNVKTKTFMNKELLQSVSKYLNKINVIRGSVSHIVSVK